MSHQLPPTPDGGDQMDPGRHIRRPDGSFDLEATLQASRDLMDKYTRDVGAIDPKRRPTPSAPF